mgnify:CR=1 FL=1
MDGAVAGGYSVLNLLVVIAGFLIATQQALNGGQSGQPGALVGTSWSYDCAEGGSAKWEVEVDTGLGGLGDFDAPEPTTGANVSATYNVFFKRCKVDGVRITGDLAYEVGVVTTESSAATTWSYTGDLVYNGDLKGSCIIDMTGSVGASEVGASVSYSGTICGNDASETLNVDFQ